MFINQDTPNTVTLSPDQLYTGPEVAALFRLHIATIYKWMRTGDFPAPIRIGPRAVRWRGAVLIEHLDRQAVVADAGMPASRAAAAA